MQIDDFNSDIFFQEDFIGYLSKVKYIFDEDLGDLPITFLINFLRHPLNVSIDLALDI